MSVNKEWEQLHSALDQILLDYGKNIVEEPKRLENLLADFAPESGKEMRAFCNTLKCERIKRYIARANELDVGYLTFCIEEDMGFTNLWASNVAVGIVRLVGNKNSSVCDEDLEKSRIKLLNDLVLALSNSLNEKNVSAIVDKEQIKYSEGLNISSDVTEGYYVYGKGDCTDIYIKIPPEYKGRPVRRIESYSFWDSRNVKGVTIPSSVKKMGKGVFDNCYNLERVELPEGLETIPTSTFWYCYALKKADIPKSVREIGKYAFYCCKSLEKVIIPDGVSVIENASFYGCEKMENLIIPATLCEIKGNAFGYCNNLKKIEFGGTCRQWLNMKRAKDWKSARMSGKIECSDGTIEF